MQEHRDIPSQLPAKDPSWVETGEMPAIQPGLATWEQMKKAQKIAAPVTPIHNWHDELPKPAYQRNLPVFRETLDLEKAAARVTWAVFGLIGFVVAVAFVGKIVFMVWALK